MARNINLDLGEPGSPEDRRQKSPTGGRDGGFVNFFIDQKDERDAAIADLEPGERLDSHLIMTGRDGVAGSGTGEVEALRGTMGAETQNVFDKRASSPGVGGVRAGARMDAEDFRTGGRGGSAVNGRRSGSGVTGSGAAARRRISLAARKAMGFRRS